MGMKYSYDEEGLAFYYFVMTLLGLYVIPTTYRLFVPASNDRFKDSVKCTCSECQVKRRRKSILKSAMTGKFAWLKNVLLFVGWALFLFSCATVYQKSRASKIYDPFEVLGISPGSNEKTVKRAYKVMTLKHHPDKAKSDKDREAANLRFIEINKAYKTLTDETARKNWEDYGNPDGPTTYSLGIALPSWLVDSKNAFFVLALYGAGFGLLIPFLVSQSWSSSKKYTKDKILQSTMIVYFQSVKQRLGLREILEIVCMSHEFLPEEFAWSTPLNAAENERLVSFLTEAKSSEKFTKPKKLESEAALRVYCLLFAHLHRIALPEENWFADQTLTVSKSVHLLSGIIKISMVREWSVTTLNAITLTQFLTQACWENQLPLLQLPHFTVERSAEFAAKTKASTIRTFLELSEDARNAALEPFNLSPEQKENLIGVASSFPDVSVLDVSFQILGQEEITPEGVVTCAVKLKLTRMDDAIKLDLTKETEKARTEKIDVEQFEFDEDGNMVESAKTVGSFKEDPRLRNQPIHAPFFPAERKTQWWIFLLGQDMQTFVCAPVKVSDLAGEKTVTMQFPTPPRPGQISLRLLIRSDCLYGGDILMDAKFTVVKESKTSRVVESDWEISDTESESENPFAQND